MKVGSKLHGKQRSGAVLALLLGGACTAAASENNHYFASIHLDDNKIGQVHYTVQYDDQGEIEELKTRASVSFLGIEVFHFSQHLHEVWRDGELQDLNGHTDDDGDVYDTSLERKPGEYDGALNGKPLVLPHDAFPTSLWHYRITEQSLLFDLKDLRLLKVEVAESADTLSVHGETVAADRFDFTGDWQGAVWFDQDRNFLRAEYQVEKRAVVVTLDP